MITLAQCTALAALAPNEIFLGPTPSAKHRLILTSYLLNLKRGPEVVRDMMVSDLRRWVDLGAAQRAADLLIVLRQFLFDYPEARFTDIRVDRKTFRPRVISASIGADAPRRHHGVKLALVRQAAGVVLQVKWPIGVGLCGRLITSDAGGRSKQMRKELEDGTFAM